MPPRSRKRDPQPAAIVASGVQAVSTLSTGDAGGRYQDAVDGWLLANLLMGSALPGIPGPIERVGFQRRNYGAFLDDAVVTVAGGVDVEFSIKAGVSVAARNEDFGETVRGAWKLQHADVRKLAGLVAPPTASGLQALKRLVAEARAHHPVGDFTTATTTPGAISADDRTRFAACRTVLDEAHGSAITDQEFYDFLRRFTVLDLDLALPPHSDVESLVTTMAASLGLSADEARSLFARLVEVGSELAISGAAVDQPGLRALLAQRGVVAGLAADLRPAAEALAAYAGRTFESRNDEVAGVRLDRAALVDEVQAGLADGKAVVVTGPSGYGKSTVVRSVYETLSAGGPVLHLSGRRLETAGSWTALADDIGVPRDRARLFELLATNPSGRTLVFDALEHVTSVGGRALVQDLVRGLAQQGPVRLVLAMRDAVVADVLNWLGDTVKALASVKVDTLSQAEVAQIATASPSLGLLIERLRPDNLPGGLLLLRLLHSARISNEELAQTPASEVDLLDLWWRHFLAGDDPRVRHDRLTITLGAAGAVVDAPAGLFRLPPGSNGAVVGDLERDGVLLLDLDAGDRYRFGHDLVQDWAIVRWLENEPQALPQRLDRLTQTPGFYRSVTLYAQRMAERETDRFRELLGAADGGRREQAFLTALVLSPLAPRLLHANAAALLENGAARLTALLTLVGTEQVDVDPSVVQFILNAGEDVGAARTFAAVNAMPRFLVWGPLIRFCLQHVGELELAYFPFLRLAEKWQRVVPPEFPYREQILRAAMPVLEELEHWRPHRQSDRPLQILDRDTDAAQKLARSIVAHAADVDRDLIASYLEELRANGYSDAQDDMLQHLGTVAAALPDQAVEYAMDVLVEPEKMLWEVDLSQLGLRHFLYFPASDVQGPFLSMLQQNETAGLTLVRRVVQHAAGRRERDMLEQGGTLRPLTFEFQGRTVTLKGDDRAYVAFRPASHESSILTSALMAVETWAVNQVRGGRDVVEIANLLLSETEDVAFVGIVIGLAYDFPDLVPALADVVARPWLWRFEQTRSGLDDMPQDLNAFLPAEFRVPDSRPELSKRNRDRDQEREQQRTPIVFAVRYFSGSDEALRQQFEARVAEMGLVDATFWIEEAANAEGSPEAIKLFEHFRSYTNPEHYVDAGNGQVRWHPPEAIMPTPNELRTMQLRQYMSFANLKGAAALRDYAAPQDLGPFETIGRLAQDALDAGRLEGDDERLARHAVLRCASALVTFLATRGERAAEWATRVVREAAATEEERSWSPDVDDEDALDFRISVATAVGALLAIDGDDDELRRLVFRAAGSVRAKVGASFLQGLKPAWDSRPETPANVLLILAQGAWRNFEDPPLQDEQIDQFVQADREGRLGPVPQLAAPTAIAAYRLSAAVAAAGVRFENAAAAEMIVPLAEQLMVRVREPRAAHDSFMWQLEREVAALCGNVFVTLPGQHQVFRDAFLDWKASPEFFASAVMAIVRGYLGYLEIADASVERFLELARPFVEADHSGALGRRRLSRGFRDACWALVMSEDFAGVILKATWPHAGRFRDHLDHWVAAVGGHPVTAAALVRFLDRFHAAFTAAQLVGWLSACAASTAANLRDEFWDTNGGAIAALVLQLQAERGPEFENADLRRTTADLADQLIAAGVPGAGDIREFLEAGAGR